MVVETVVVALWAMLPAYVPNNAAVLFGGGAPIDGGREWRGRRLLGDGKTWRGTAVGIAAGVALAIVLDAVQPAVSGATGFDIPGFPLAVGAALAAGAMLGDILASFLKRRTGRDRGAAFPGLDQLDFVVVSLLLVALVAPTWFRGVFLSEPLRLVVVLVATPLLHLVTNAGAYVLGLKDEPY
ncbi:CDP-2,3-bis-(O-geranylgeranyl)-sn-glycerol synthase [Halorarius halobius]|uniref:CDP-2,3-bis-(O-geranylgeranyl)-sn-glycerol synthase n=1 Tax=Halorarius halobius TaxID=2962671 RepID=UPI0020CC7576|nr:CDP-2,3-bis-(O-geranylgeranyl)-sn-glycerol synthase [Halorarius halobius]